MAQSLDPHLAEARLEELLGKAEVSMLVLESVPGGVVVVSLAGGIMHANAEAQALLGLSYSDLTRRYVSDFDLVTFHEDGSPCAAEDYPVSVCLSTGERQGPVTIGVEQPSGDRVWCVFNAIPVVSPEDETLLGAIVTFLDLTPRREAEQALRASESRYRSLVHNIQDTVLIIDRDERILFINRVAQGFSLEQVLGAKLGAFSNDLESIRLGWAAVFERGETCAVDNEASNGRIYSGHWLPLERDAEGVVQTAMIVTSDVTTLRLDEADRRRLQEDLARRVGELNVLAGGIAHDFNNVLQGILGSADWALRQLPEEHPARPPLEDVLSDARHAGDLTRQLLAYSGSGQLCIEPVDLEELLTGMWRLVRANVSRRAKVKLDLAGGLPAVEADATQLRQIVMNLATNASEALGEEGGLIEISTGCVDLETARLSTVLPLSEPYAARYVLLEVKDDGCGMEERTRTRVFDAFFSTKSRSGRGLGMAAVAGIVRAHRGAVALSSRLGEGTTVRVLLPALAASVSTSGEHPLPELPAAPIARAGRILVVEDDERARRIAQLALESRGYEVVAVASARAARSTFAGEPSFSLALIDMILGDGQGADLIREFLALDPELPIVACSGYQEASLRVDLRDSLAGFLPKPYSLDELLRLVNRARR